MSGGLVCLYMGDGETCWNCGGWVKAIGEDGQPGPFPGDSRYCCEECYAEDQRRSADARARVRCCPECGFDNAEHKTRADEYGPACSQAEAGRG